ncbi:MAG: arylsulfotransferase family protein [Gammaproteobacteria bacterium]
MSPIFVFFPYPLIRSAGRAANALLDLYLERQNTVHRIRSEDGRGGVTTYEPYRAYDGLTLLTLFSGERNVAVLVDMSGRELHRWSILFANARPNPRADYEDPLHLNDAELIPGSAAGHPLFTPGDVLLSLRNIDALIALDLASERIKWSRTGPFLRQHDPDFLPNGNLLVFDNRTDTDQHHQVQHLTEPQAFGYSRVIEIEPATGRVIWEFAGSREKPFYSSINGMAERLPNGNHLIVEPEAGRVLEIAGTTEPQVVWEYRNR